MAVFSLPPHEKQLKTKHVESSLVPRLDEGSSPSSSTWRVGQIPANKSPNKTKPHNINSLCGFSVPKNDDSGPSSDRKKTTQDAHWWQISGRKFCNTKLPLHCHQKSRNYVLCSMLQNANSEINGQNRSFSDTINPRDFMVAVAMAYFTFGT